MPGLAKTLMISTLAKSLSLAFSRIQFTPDLMPSDITGTEVIEENRSHRRTASSSSSQGPLFANVILADEINRTPPKTQAALLEAMQERQVTVGRVRHRARRPVLRAGHAEPDRAGRHLSAARGAAGPLHVQGVRATIPSFDEEFEIARRTTALIDRGGRSRCWRGEQILELQKLVRRCR